MVDEEGSERKPADDEREVQLTRPKHGQTAVGALSATRTDRRTSVIWLVVAYSTLANHSGRLEFTYVVCRDML